MENQRAVAVLFMIGGALVGVFFRSLTIAIMTFRVLEDPMIAGIAPLSTLIGVVSGVIGFLVLLRNTAATTFVDSVVSELLRVTWPTRDETFSNTGIVIGSTVFFASLLAVYDFVWAKLTEIFLYTTG